MGMGQPDRSRRQIAAGRSRVDTVDGRGECRDDRNCGDNCEDFQSDMGTSSVAPVEIVVHGQHLPRPESTQAQEAGSTRVSPPTSDPISPSSRGHRDRSGGLYVAEPPKRRASAANINATPSPTMMGPHSHEIVAIIIRIVRVGIGPADPEKGEIPEVVTVVEAPARQRHLVTGLDRFDRGFGLAASFENCIACKRDVRCVGLRHPVNNGARLRQ
jgi:hypothetical protein